MHSNLDKVFRPRCEGRLILCGLLALGWMAANAGGAVANELGGNTSWQFRTPADRQVSLGTVDLINRYRGNYFQQWNNSYTYNTYNSTSSVMNGDQLNCSLNASSMGNSGTTSGYASTSSPSVVSNPSTSASAAGNQTSGSSGSSPGTSTGPLNSVQDSYGSPVNAGVSGTSSSAGVGPNSGTSTSSQILNSTQSSTNSPSSSSVTGSTACAGIGGTGRSAGRSR